MELVAASRLMTSRQLRHWLPGVSRTNMGQNINDFEGTAVRSNERQQPLVHTRRKERRYYAEKRLGIPQRRYLLR